MGTSLAISVKLRAIPCQQIPKNGMFFCVGNLQIPRKNCRFLPAWPELRTGYFVDSERFSSEKPAFAVNKCTFFARVSDGGDDFEESCSIPDMALLRGKRKRLTGQEADIDQ